MRPFITLLSLVFSAFGVATAAPRVVEVDGEHVVLQLGPADDVRPGEAATLFFARQLSKQRVEVHVAEILVESCLRDTCRAVVTRHQQPIQPGYEMILHRVRAPVAVQAAVPVDGAPATAGPGRAVEPAAEVRAERGPVFEVVSTPPGALVQLDGDDVGTTPIAFALERVVPAHVALTLAGYEYQELEVVPRANETVRLAPHLVRRRPVASAGWRVAGIVTTSLGAALATAGGVLMFVGDAERQRADDRHQHYLALPPGGPSAAYVDAWLEVEHAVDRSRLYGRSGASLLGVGGGLMAFGLLAWLDPFDWFASAPVAVPTPDGNGALLEWRTSW